ncbi:uncharacterized protein EI90DRAFT_3135036 [Cantharellus anzutake]|uniref:uncharacterized protein n=1 Tax=Cantharellus anzutake TaxID=1750568 RepID=UPI001907EDC5|nr:uncharacterized protein EI90DRAFT_3135036 [Cantharellus anzutake]KAF8315760.1 hypothetical protein EI90DRAFT_3135036 [Cantharellus anzutake]
MFLHNTLKLSGKDKRENELMYVKSRDTAEDIFKTYVQASRGVYQWDDKEMEVFGGNVSEPFILDFYIAWKTNGNLPKGEEWDVATIEKFVPWEVFTKEMARMVKEHLLAPLLETSKLTFRKTSILDHLGYYNFALIDYEGHKAPIEIIAPKSIEANEGWSQLRMELLDAFLKMPQSISMPAIQVTIQPHTSASDPDCSLDALKRLSTPAIQQPTEVALTPTGTRSTATHSVSSRKSRKSTLPSGVRLPPLTSSSWKETPMPPSTPSVRTRGFGRLRNGIGDLAWKDLGLSDSGGALCHCWLS